MGDRVLMQCYNSETKEFGPVVYGHWSGDAATGIVRRLALRMKQRPGDVSYSTARLVQEMLASDGTGCLGYGVWNATHLLTEDDSHGDAGVVLIDVSKDHEATYFGGYL